MSDENEHGNGKRSVPEMSRAARLLQARLAKMQPNEKILVGELCAVAGVELKKNRGPIYTAFRALAREQNMRFGNIRGVGYERLDDSGIASDVARDVKLIGRKARRTGQKTTAITDLAGLPAEERATLIANVSIAAAIAQGARETTVRKLAVAAENSKAVKRLPLDDTIAMFAKD